MKTKNLFALLATLFISNVSLAAPGNGGLSECIGLSVQAALDVYGKSHQLNRIPTIVVSKSDTSPSNGVDVMVRVDDHITYYVVANPVGEISKLEGCDSAFVADSK